jgi:hypothetical protein
LYTLGVIGGGAKLGSSLGSKQYYYWRKTVLVWRQSLDLDFKIKLPKT